MCSPFTSMGFTGILADAGIQISMDGRRRAASEAPDLVLWVVLG